MTPKIKVYTNGPLSTSELLPEREIKLLTESFLFIRYKEVANGTEEAHNLGLLSL